MYISGLLGWQMLYSQAEFYNALLNIHDIWALNFLGKRKEQGRDLITSS